MHVHHVAQTTANQSGALHTVVCHSFDWFAGWHTHHAIGSEESTLFILSLLCALPVDVQLHMQQQHLWCCFICFCGLITAAGDVYL
jgi:hypothetical protein